MNIIATQIGVGLNFSQFIGRELNKNAKIRNETRRYFDLEVERAEKIGDENINQSIASLHRIEHLILECDGISVLENLEKRSSPNVFFEKLASQVKNSGIWAQQKCCWLTKTRLRTRERIVENLKTNYNENFARIFSLSGTGDRQSPIGNVQQAYSR